MNFEEKDIALSIDGMGFVFFSPETNIGKNRNSNGFFHEIDVYETEKEELKNVIISGAD